MDNEGTEPIRLLEIEKELAGPERETALARYDAVLVGLQHRIDEAMRAGLPPDEYQSASSLSEANTVARKLLRLAVREGGAAH